MPKVDKTGMILIGGAVGLGLILLPGFFSGRLKVKDGEPGLEDGDPGLEPMELEPYVPVPEVEEEKERKQEKPKSLVVSVGPPTLVVESNRTSTGYSSINGSRNRGVGNHMKAATVDVWDATNVAVFVDWDMKNTGVVTSQMDFSVRLRMVEQASFGTFFSAKSWYLADAFGRDDTWFEYKPGAARGIEKDKFFDAFSQGVQTTHGASRGQNPALLSIGAGQTKKLKMGLHLPGPGRSKDLREFWEANPQFNFKIEVYANNVRIAEHEFKDAFSTSINRPNLVARPYTGKNDSPTLTVRSL
jgi:hypothetical protein